MCLTSYTVHEIAAIIKTSEWNAAKDITGTQLTGWQLWWCFLCCRVII